MEIYWLRYTARWRFIEKFISLLLRKKKTDWPAVSSPTLPFPLFLLSISLYFFFTPLKDALPSLFLRAMQLSIAFNAHPSWFSQLSLVNVTDVVQSISGWRIITRFDLRYSHGSTTPTRSRNRRSRIRSQSRGVPAIAGVFRGFPFADVFQPRGKCSVGELNVRVRDVCGSPLRI